MIRLADDTVVRAARSAAPVGIQLDTPAATSRDFGSQEAEEIGSPVLRVLEDRNRKAYGDGIRRSVRCWTPRHSREQ